MRLWKVITSLGVAAVLTVCLGMAWLVGTESGLHYAARHLPPELRMEGLHGALLRDITAERIRYEKDGTRIAGNDVRFRLELLSFLGGRAGLRSMHARELEIQLTPGEKTTPPKIPGIRVGEASVGRLVVQGVTIADLKLGESVVLDSGVSGGGSFRIPAHDAALQVSVKGTLDRVEAHVEGTVASIPVKANALLTPFAARPIETMEAQAGPVDARKWDASWPRTALDIRMRGTPEAGRVSIANSDPGPLDAQKIPLTGLEGAFKTDFKTVQLSDLEMRLTGGILRGHAELSQEKVLLDVQASDLDLRGLRSNLRETRLSGPLRIAATKAEQSVQGTLAQPGMQITADLTRRGERVEVRALRALAGGGEARGHGTVTLSSPLRADAKVELARFDPSRFGDFPHGSLNGALALKGTLNLADAQWNLSGRLVDEPFATRGAAKFSRDRIAQADAEARLGAKRLTLRGDFGRPGDALSWTFQDARLQSQGKVVGALDRHAADFTVRGPDIDAAAQVRGSWRGQAGWSGEVLALRNNGRYALRLLSPATLAVRPKKVELARFDAEVGPGRLRIAALDWTPQRVVTSGDFSRLPAQWLLAAAGLSEELKSTLLLDGKWTVTSAPRLAGAASLRRAGGDLSLADGTALRLEGGEIDARFTDGVIQLDGSVQSSYAAAQMKGQISPAPGAPGIGITRESPVSFSASVKFAELRTLARGLTLQARMDGRLSAEIRGSGTLGHPVLDGNVRGDALAFDVPPYGVYLKNGELRARLEGNALVLERFSIQGGEGTFRAEGRLAKENSRVTWRAEHLSLLERPDMRLVASGEGEASFAERKLSLSGELRAERGFLDLEQDRLPKLGDDVVVAGQPRGKERASGPSVSHLALDIGLDLGKAMEVKGYGLEGKLTGRLEFETADNGDLRAFGRVQAVNATFLAYGQRLQVDPGIAVFDGDLRNPALQMTAWRRNQAVEAGVQVSGTARAPRVQVVSQPPVPEGERLSWLVLGRAPSDATKADLGMLQAAAGALLARGTETPLDQRIARAFGFDEVSLRGTGEVASQVVALGKRLSDRLYISFEQGIGAAASALVKLDFTLTQRVSLRAETGTSSGLGLFYRFSWD